MLEPWYVTGFCDGEAVFTYSRASGSFALYFAVKQKEDNCQIIEEIYKFFNYVGYIYRGKESEKLAEGGAAKPPVYYRVTKSNELQVVIDHFDKYPLQSKKKYEIYKIWREMIRHKIENFRNPNHDLLQSLAEKLSSLNFQGRVLKIYKK